MNEVLLFVYSFNPAADTISHCFVVSLHCNDLSTSSSKNLLENHGLQILPDSSRRGTQYTLMLSERSKIIKLAFLMRGQDSILPRWPNHMKKRQQQEMMQRFLLLMKFCLRNFARGNGGCNSWRSCSGKIRGQLSEASTCLKGLAQSRFNTTAIRSVTPVIFLSHPRSD